MLRDIGFYLQRTSKFFREVYRLLSIFLKDNKKKKGKGDVVRIGYDGYWSPQDDWFQGFIETVTGKEVIASWYKPSLVITSCFGSYWLLKIILSLFKGPTIFFSGENLATLKKYREYQTYLDGTPSLAMGYDYSDHEGYQRFPLWLRYIFSPNFAATATVADVQLHLDTIEKRAFGPKTKFATMIARHDGYASAKKVFGCVEPLSRAALTQEVNKVDFVHCPGRLLHNDDSLEKEYGDDKKAYIQQFCFNICAENASVKGYVTEKLFEALEGGTIPIYWGDENPEPTILNPQRIIFWDDDCSNDVLTQIRDLYLDEKKREIFLSQPVFTETAALEIHKYFVMLRDDMRRFLL